MNDETDMCLLIKNYLVKRNYAVHTAHTLQDGLRLLPEINPDVLLLDDHLPDGLGWKEAPAIKTIFPKLKITLISGAETRDACASIDGFLFQVLEKPVTMMTIENYLY
jgi:DNA-binding response OmpR family regulator